MGRDEGPENRYLRLADSSLSFRMTDVNQLLFTCGNDHTNRNKKLKTK